ncbi:hypothetical protein MAE_58150 [Microcystis aeruginosa NIES-843]|nr:hypothetical protein [Microcystis aeruginosa]BAG00861.1 hypothetical protein MAE_10390 [Microcystis aeruginosa NIES-843]BAG05637.1 hypothetical protein MAE_58150 [Microcystis aeruginosa NIES-843]
MLSSLIIELEQKLRDCSLEDKQWLLEQLHQQLGLNNQKTTKQRLIDSWNEAYSDGLDESETLMLERIRHHQSQLSE